METISSLTTTTRRAEQIHEQRGCSWESACLEAEHERDFEAKFPESTFNLDGVVVHTTGPNHDCVMWMSDWTRWPELKDAGLLRAEYGGPDTYGHISLYVAS